MELDQRKLKVLSAIVETFTATGEPVGSKLVALLLGGTVSSATVRNDMQALFEMGLIEQPHTSAGRIPSHMGYRIYVDRLMKLRPLGKQEKNEIDALFNVLNPDPDQLLKDAAANLADYTGCATISTTYTSQSVYVKHIELIPVSQRTLVIVLVASSGVIKNKVCRVEFNITPKLIEFFASFANGVLTGVSINEITSRFISSAAISLGEYSRLLNPLLSAIYELCREVSQGQCYQSGASNLLVHDELRQVAHELLTLLGRRDDVVGLVSGQGGGIQITIGKEHNNMELAGSSLVISRYKTGDNSGGAIAVLGPVRMDYAKIVPHLEYFAKRLGTLLSETLEESS